MKKTFNYPELWQQKRNELPVYGDPDADWMEMQAALDKLMPVTIAIKKPYNPNGLKGLYKLFIGFSTAAVIYGSTQFYFSKKQEHVVKNIHQKSIPAIPAPVKKDSVIILPQPVIQLPDKPGPNNNSIIKNDKPLNSASKVIHPDSIKSATENNGIVHRDSALSTELPLFARPVADSATGIKEPSGMPILDNKAAQKNAAGNSKPAKKKKHRIQISL